MQMLAVVASLLLLLLWPARRGAGAAEYVVGEVNYGWESGSGINYDAWAREHGFAVGDVLVFQYVSSQHNVYEVTEEVYRSCDTIGGGDGGVRAKYSSGYDRVVLAEERSYWFLCNVPGHCLGGMRVAVNVSATGSAAGGGGSPPDGSTSGGASSTTTTGGRRGWAAGCLLALAVLALMRDLVAVLFS